MKNVLIGIVDSNFGGINRYIVDYTLKTADKEHKFVFLYNSMLNEFYRKELSDDCCYEFIPSIMHPVAIYNSVKKIIKRYSIDELYLNVSTNLFYPVLKAAFDCNVNERVLHSHSSYTADESLIKRSIIVLVNKFLQKKTFKMSTRRLACSDKAAKWLFGSTESFEFIYNKVDPIKFRFNEEKRKKIRKELNLEKFLIIGFVGGFNYPKNIKCFFDIAAKLKKLRNDFCIVMLGDGPQRKSFEKKVISSSLQENFKLLGNKANANDYYNAFDCFVLTSRFEGLPIVGIEAQVNGLPVFMNNRITKFAKITENCEFFYAKKLKELIKALSDLSIRKDSEIMKLENYKDFIFEEKK